MKVPDKIYFTEDFVCGINCNKPVPGKRNVEYIRKDALLEWANAQKDALFASEITDVAAGLNAAYDLLIFKLERL